MAVARLSCSDRSTQSEPTLSHTVLCLRIARLATCVAIIAAGLALRRYGYALGLPFEVVKYGGSVLWGAMVYFIVASFAPRSQPTRVALSAASIAIAVELFRLVHTPGLDAFRLTTVGALLLGRVFSPWNIVAYLVGITGAAALDRVTIQRR